MVLEQHPALSVSVLSSSTSTLLSLSSLFMGDERSVVRGKLLGLSPMISSGRLLQCNEPDHNPAVPVWGKIVYECEQPDQMFYNWGWVTKYMVVTCSRTGEFDEPAVWPVCGPS